MSFSKQDLTKLGVIHSLIVKHFVYTSDFKKFKLAEYWEGDVLGKAMLKGSLKLKGDCEEYAMTCMRKCVDSGYSARIVACMTETNEGHAICEVASPDGKAALYFDNRRQRIVRREELQGYRFLSCSPWNPKPRENRPWTVVRQ